jgi:hypothetical protein
LGASDAHLMPHLCVLLSSVPLTVTRRVLLVSYHSGIISYRRLQVQLLYLLEGARARAHMDQGQLRCGASPTGYPTWLPVLLHHI